MQILTGPNHGAQVAYLLTPDGVLIEPIQVASPIDELDAQKGAASPGS